MSDEQLQFIPSPEIISLIDRQNISEQDKAEIYSYIEAFGRKKFGEGYEYSRQETRDLDSDEIDELHSNLF